VADNGRGISPQFLPYVFDRFRQQDASTTREAFGLGLGLSIAKHLVELHGGTIEAFSAGAGQGATFVVMLPASLPAPLADSESPDVSRVVLEA
jgi:signal transduction histidine kinase